MLQVIPCVVLLKSPKAVYDGAIGFYLEIRRENRWLNEVLEREKVK